ncbi:MAG: type II secretion system GspH family protein [Firmicutes bacterium]|nr:type II secretion system GspH family protein [Bacillota bacterium]
MLRKTVRSHGFSLLEVLVSLFILIFCILLVLEIFPLSVKAANRGRKIILATQLAKKEIEFAKHLKWDDLTSANIYLQTRQTRLTTRINGIESINEFTTVYTVAPFEEDPDNIKLIKVAVYWDGAYPSGNVNNKVDMEVMVARED